jgi:hypothetical protein
MNISKNDTIPVTANECYSVHTNLKASTLILYILLVHLREVNMNISPLA